MSYSQAVMDERTCEACAFLNATDATPPHSDCTNVEDGCRCIATEDLNDENG